jgi:hypothetical protein
MSPPYPSVPLLLFISISFYTIRDGILKLLRSPGIDSKKSIPPAYVDWGAGTTTLFPL